LFDRDSLRPGDGAAADRGGMIGNRTGKSVGEIGVSGMEGEELNHCSVEIFDVFGLGLIPASGVGFFAFGIVIGGSLGFEFGTNLVWWPPPPKCPVRRPSAPSFLGRSNDRQRLSLGELGQRLQVVAESNPPVPSGFYHRLIGRNSESGRG
jgi:hypothetical protein